MTNEQKYILQLTNKFVEQKGKGSCYAFKPIKPENIIFSFINLHRQKRTDTTILIVVRNYDERLKIKSLLEDNNLLDKITILSRSYMKTNYNYNYTFTFIIGQDDFDFLNHLTNQSKFTFAIFTELITDGVINNILPIIKPNITFNDLCKDRLNYPVEETHIPITMSDENKLEYYKYSEYINTSMSIFGSFENADKCRIGDMVLNISAGEFRYNLAKENGWSETLDTSIEFNKNIDDIYNPNSLFERANTLYNIIRERINLVTDNISKIPAIIDILSVTKLILSLIILYRVFARSNKEFGL